jgi:hypothetical protein
MVSPGLEVIFNKKIDGEIKMLYGKSVTTVWQVWDFRFTASSNHVNLILIQM